MEWKPAVIVRLRVSAQRVCTLKYCSMNLITVNTYGLHLLFRSKLDSKVEGGLVLVVLERLLRHCRCYGSIFNEKLEHFKEILTQHGVALYPVYHQSQN